MALFPGQPPHMAAGFPQRERMRVREHTDMEVNVFFFLIYLFYLFIFGCVGSSLLGAGFL